MSPEPKLIPPSDRYIEKFASVPHTPQQNVSGPQTKTLIPQELDQSQQNSSTQPVFPYLVSPGNTDYASCTIMSQLLAVHSITANSNIFAVFVPMIHMPLISTTRLWCVHITLSPHPMAIHPRKNGIHPGFITDPTPTTDKYPQLHRQSRQ